MVARNIYEVVTNLTFRNIDSVTSSGSDCCDFLSYVQRRRVIDNETIDKFQIFIKSQDLHKIQTDTIDTPMKFQNYARNAVVV